jgi:hypothetical protein
MGVEGGALRGRQLAVEIRGEELDQLAAAELAVMQARP